MTYSKDTDPEIKLNAEQRTRLHQVVLFVQLLNNLSKEYNLSIDPDNLSKELLDKARKKLQLDSNFNLIKFRKKDLSMDHSFLLMGDKIMEIKDTLGQGGFGTVKRVRDLNGNEYALKIEKTKHDVVEFINNEKENIKVQRELKGPNQSSFLIDFGMRQSTNKGMQSFYKSYKLMPLISGKDMSKLFLNLTTREKLTFFKKMVQCVDELHANNIIHRDLKLENIMFDYDEKNGIIRDAYLIDLDNAVKLNNQGLYKETKALIQTPKYLDPTVLKTHTYSKQTDIYALGTTLLNLFGLEIPNDVEALKFKTLLKGMRNPDMQERFTTEQIISKIDDLLVSYDNKLRK